VRKKGAEREGRSSPEARRRPDIPVEKREERGEIKIWEKNEGKRTDKVIGGEERSRSERLLRESLRTRSNLIPESGEIKKRDKKAILGKERRGGSV